MNTLRRFWHTLVGWFFAAKIALECLLYFKRFQNWIVLFSSKVGERFSLVELLSSLTGFSLQTKLVILLTLEQKGHILLNSTWQMEEQHFLPKVKDNDFNLSLYRTLWSKAHGITCPEAANRGLGFLLGHLKGMYQDQVASASKDLQRKVRACVLEQVPTEKLPLTETLIREQVEAQKLWQLVSALRIADTDLPAVNVTLAGTLYPEVTVQFTSKWNATVDKEAELRAIFRGLGTQAPAYATATERF